MLCAQFHRETAVNCLMRESLLKSLKGTFWRRERTDKVNEAEQAEKVLCAKTKKNGFSHFQQGFGFEESVMSPIYSDDVPSLRKGPLEGKHSRTKEKGSHTALTGKLFSTVSQDMHP